MEEVCCPRCKTTRYRNPALKLMVNVCGHALCENCMDLLFVRGSGACPECGIALRRSNFRTQMFEDARVEKEVDIRKKILREFNKKEEDFGSLREYNDYLEQVETIIFNLTNGTDVEKTKKLVEQNKRENQELIKKNRMKLSHDEELIEALIEQERQSQSQHRLQAQQEEEWERKQKRKQKEALIDDLMFLDMPANRIVQTHRQEAISLAGSRKDLPDGMPKAQLPTTQFSTGISLHPSQQHGFMPMPKLEVGELYEYNDLKLIQLGPEEPNEDCLIQNGYLTHIRPATSPEQAGGYRAVFACHRALQEAFCGLFFGSADLLQATSTAQTSSTHGHSSMDIG
ncbi:CDK-activating kinase assembly factor MAT1 [Lamellibrachia satsuma]|nr:CDK-activating kinase assembly factor MAT1 [Lamellibrachia satsuma]